MSACILIENNYSLLIRNLGCWISMCDIPSTVILQDQSSIEPTKRLCRPIIYYMTQSDDNNSCMTCSLFKINIFQINLQSKKHNSQVFKFVIKMLKVYHQKYTQFNVSKNEQLGMHISDGLGWIYWFANILTSNLDAWSCFASWNLQKS